MNHGRAHILDEMAAAPEASSAPIPSVVTAASVMSQSEIQLDEELPIVLVPGDAPRLSFAGGLAFPYYTQIVVPEKIDQVAENYLSWALGLGDHARLRDRRLQQGVNPSWTVKGCMEGTDLAGREGLMVSVRATRGLWAFRFVHPEERRDGGRSKQVVWWTVARVTPAKNGCKIEHAVIRQTPKPEPFPGNSVVPAIIKSYLDRYQGQGPVRMGHAALRLRGDEAAKWTREVLLNPDRRVPAFVASLPRELGTRHLVDVDHVARTLQGMVAAVTLEDKRAAWAMQDVLSERGFDSKAFACFNGAVRVYGADLSPRDNPLDHRIWISNQLASKTHDQRIQLVSDEIVQCQVAHNLPARFVMSLEDTDRRIQGELSEAARVESVSRQVEAGDRIQALEAEVEGLKAEVTRMKDEVGYMERLVEIGDGEIAMIRMERDTLSRKLFAAESQAEAMAAHAQGAASRSRGGARPSQEVLEAVDAVLTGKPSLVQALLYLEWRYPDRIRIHEKAWDSARHATDEGFLYPDQAWELLRRLATEYFDILAAGGQGDAGAKSVFGSKFAGRESQSTEGIKKARDLRERSFEGKTYPMLRHLKIGVSEGAREGWRCHFDWDAESQRILIGHCGQHLDLR